MELSIVKYNSKSILVEDIHKPHARKSFQIHFVEIGEVVGLQLQIKVFFILLKENHFKLNKC